MKLLPFVEAQDGEDFQPQEDPQDAAISSKQCFTAVETTIATRSSPVFSLAKIPINLNTLGKELKFYETQKALTILNGFSFEFPLHYIGPRQPQDANNLKSARDRPEVVWQTIMKEVEAGRVAGPFDTNPLPALRVSPLGFVPKKEPGEYSLIHHLSYPPDESLNDFIDQKLCSVQYTQFDAAINMVQELGKGCLLGKSDIKSAFRLLPVSAFDYDQLGFMFDGKFYFDKAMPFGCSIACKTLGVIYHILRILCHEAFKDW